MSYIQFLNEIIREYAINTDFDTLLILSGKFLSLDYIWCIVMISFIASTHSL